MILQIIALAAFFFLVVVFFFLIAIDFIEDHIYYKTGVRNRDLLEETLDFFKRIFK